MVIKNINIHLGYLTGAIAATAAAYTTAAGTLQNYIKFAGVDSEIGFFILSSGTAALFFFASFTKSK